MGMFNTGMGLALSLFCVVYGQDHYCIMIIVLAIVGHKYH